MGRCVRRSGRRVRAPAAVPRGEVDTVIDKAAETIAVTMIREAFAHLPADRAAGALAMARTEPLVRMLTAITVTAYDAGRSVGIRQGRLELEREMEADWRPVAERVRAQAGSPSHDELQLSRWELADGKHLYRGGPVESW